MQVILYLIVSFLASVIGAVCGIGGGVIIKPVLDLCGLASVSTISFLSGCTVLSMSCYSVAKNLSTGESRVDMKTGTPLAIGGALGGILGKQMFSAVRAMFANPNTVGAVHSQNGYPPPAERGSGTPGPSRPPRRPRHTR